VHVPATHRAGGTHDGPEAAHVAPSAAAGEHVPPKTALHVPLAGQSAKLVGTMIELAPQIDAAKVRRRQRRLIVSQPTA
jgi:hypothetical protein